MGRAVWLFFVLLGAAVFALAAISSDVGRYRSPEEVQQVEASVETAVRWIRQWLGLGLLGIAPLAGVWMMRTRTLSWVLFPALTLFAAGAALVGVGAWGPYLVLAAVALAVGAVALHGRDRALP